MEYCYECDKDVSVTITDEVLSANIGGVAIQYDGKAVYCDICGSEVYVQEISDKNIDTAHHEYKKNICTK